MSFADARNRIRADSASSVVVVALAALILAACAGPAASSVPAEESVEPSAEASAPATPSAEPSASAVVDELCLPAEILAAIEEIGDGNFEPDVPLTDIADAVEALDVSGLDDPSFAELLRDDLVTKLLEEPEFQASLGFAATGFLSEVEVAEC